MDDMKKNDRGFTLGELLIVVGIVAILVAISIPIFTSKLEKSRETTCLANRRSLYGEMVTDYLSDDYPSLNDAFNELYLNKKSSEEYTCPSGGTYSWQDNGDGTGKIICSYHDGGGDSGGGSAAGDVLGTGIQAVASYWPEQSQYVNTWDTINIPAGGIFQYTDGSYYVVTSNLDLNKSQAESGPGGTVYGWYSTQKITGRVVTFSGSEQKSDLARGDICKQDGKYYVYKDGGTWGSSPSISPGQWYLLP